MNKKPLELTLDMLVVLQKIHSHIKGNQFSENRTVTDVTFKINELQDSFTVYIDVTNCGRLESILYVSSILEYPSSVSNTIYDDLAKFLD